MVHKLDDIPAKRINEVLPFKDYDKKDIEQAADLISQMLKWVPNQRISCDQALKHKFFKDVVVPS